MPKGDKVVSTTAAQIIKACGFYTEFPLYLRSTSPADVPVPWCRFSPALLYSPPPLFLLLIQCSSFLLTHPNRPPPIIFFSILPWTMCPCFLPYLCLQSHILLRPSCAEDVCVALHGLRATWLIGRRNTGNTRKVLSTY